MIRRAFQNVPEEHKQRILNQKILKQWNLFTVTNWAHLTITRLPRYPPPPPHPHPGNETASFHYYLSCQLEDREWPI